MNREFDLVIVGAGIVGAACATECARAGLKVLVLDRGAVGAGTTAAGMGHLVVMDDTEAHFALTNYSRRLWFDLRSQLPGNVEYDACGTLWVAANDEEMAEAQRKSTWYRERGARAAVLDAAQLSSAEPNLRAGLAGALHVPDDGVVYPPCAALFLIEQACRHGAALRTGVEARELLPDGTVLLQDGSLIASERAVNAAGPWAPALMPGLPVRKRKGHLLITDRYPGFVRHQVVELGYHKSAHTNNHDSVAFNIQPRKTGQLLIGSSRQFAADDHTVDYSILGRMLKRATEYIPALGGLSAIRVWTGHRAATPDKLPLIGPSLLGDRIWLATGHEGLGIITSLGTGRLLADLLLGKPTEIPSEPYAPGRFANDFASYD